MHAVLPVPLNGCPFCVDNAPVVFHVGPDSDLNGLCLLKGNRQNQYVMHGHVICVVGFEHTVFLSIRCVEHQVFLCVAVFFFSCGFTHFDGSGVL